MNLFWIYLRKRRVGYCRRAAMLAAWRLVRNQRSF